LALRAQRVQQVQQELRGSQLLALPSVLLVVQLQEVQPML
jgi:hypothetical protein